MTVKAPPPSYRHIKRSMDDEEIIAAYLAGDDPDTVGFKAGVHAQTVLKILRASGVALRPPNRIRRDTKVVDELEVCRRYKAGESGVILAYAFGVGVARVYRILRRHAVPRRSFIDLLTKRHKAERQRRERGDG
jgi:hypothetical protein